MTATRWPAVTPFFAQGRDQTVGQRVELRQAVLPVLEHEHGRLGHVLSFPAGQADPTSVQ
jgi:hypothetical protein